MPIYVSFLCKLLLISIFFFMRKVSEMCVMKLKIDTFNKLQSSSINTDE